MVRFLTRPGCHICDDARSFVISEVEMAGGHVVEVDVDSDDRLVRDYGMRIPVVLGDDGKVFGEGLINQRGLRKALKTLL